MEEKEQKLLRLYESQQQRAFQRVGRGSAGGSSTASLSSSTSTLASVGLGGGGGGGGGAGKVRQLFEERRTNGWDRSYPLEPVAGGKARSGPHPAQQQQQAFAHTQALPLAVPKTKVARGASLDRSHAAHAPHAKSVARRSKSHARSEALHAADDPAANKLYYDGGGHGYRKIPAASNNAHHHHNNNNNHQHHVDEYNNRNNYRRQQVAPPHDDNYEDDFEDDVNYETLGEDVPRHARNGNGNSNGFTVLPDKRQEELFAKYQVRELRNHDLLVNTSPPPDAYDVDGIDDSTFIYEKPANVGGPLRAAEEPVNNSDRFKTYVSNKHGQRALYKEEITPRAPSHAMATRASEAKKAPAGRRESLSPPTRAAPAARPAPRKPQEQKPSTGSKTLVKSPPGSLSSTGAIAPKQGASSPSPTSSKMKNGPSSQTLRTAPSRDDLTECHICHRRFTNDRIKVHEEICSKTAQKKRKEYDATKHRVQGTEAEQFVKRAVKNGPQKKVEPKKADWRKKHEEFIQTIRAAKEAQAHVAAGGKLSDLPPPPPLDTSDYIQCPHCGRRFNEAAAERHIPRCANMQHNKPKAPANKSSGSFCKRR
ncbi:Uncharacterized protein GBIM_04023 [Gryllus bimaculatus]|nr:Uncharacterized protein GBIM_04023 [Gryllus bimaculatus]